MRSFIVQKEQMKGMQHVFAVYMNGEINRPEGSTLDLVGSHWDHSVIFMRFELILFPLAVLVHTRSTHVLFVRCQNLRTITNSLFPICAVFYYICYHHFSIQNPLVGVTQKLRTHPSVVYQLLVDESLDELIDEFSPRCFRWGWIKLHQQVVKIHKFMDVTYDCFC